VGSGVVARLNELRLQCIPFISTHRSLRYDRTGSLRFANRRAEAWWLFRDLLDPQTNPAIALPPDDDLLAELIAPHYRMMSNGRVVVESKDELRKRLGRSTDRADAVIMACFYAEDDPEAFGLLTCEVCGESYNPPPPGQTRPCPYCSGQLRRFRPAPLG
jgi:hypothetical protein